MNKMSCHRRLPVFLGLSLGTLLVFSAMACSRDRSSDQSSSTVAVDTLPKDASGIQIVEAAAVRASELAPLIAPVGDGWTRDDAWLLSPAMRRGGQEDQLRARVGIRADQRLEVVFGKTDKYAVQTLLVGARPVAAQLDRGRALFASAFESTDVVVTALDSAIEQFLVLRGPAAPKRFTWNLGHSPALVRTATDSDGSLVFLDKTGEPVMGVLAPVALDANGLRRAATMSLEGTLLHIELDTTDLAYPIVLDPAIESWVFQEMVVSPNPGVRWGAASAVLAQSIFERPLVFGGMVRTGTINAPSNELWQWNAGAWVKITPNATVPFALSDVAMVASVTQSAIFTYGGIEANGDYSNRSYRLTNAFTSPSWANVPNAESPLARHRMFRYLTDTAPEVLYTFGGQISATEHITTMLNRNAGSFGWGVGPTLPVALQRRDSAMAQVHLPTGVNTFIDTGYIYGGRLAAGAIVGGLYRWSGTAWVEVCPSCSPNPGPRSGAQMAHDPRRGVLVLYGGLTQTVPATTAQDVWEFNIAAGSWSSKAPLVSPGSRSDAVFQWAVSPRRVLLSGGKTASAKLSAYYSKTYLYGSRGGVCPSGTSVSCDDFCVDGVCCEVSACGTCERCDGSSPGVCTAVTAGEVDDSCTAGFQCSASKECKKSVGGSCTTDSDCYGGFCADGVCCNQACSGACDVCKKGVGGNTSPDGTCVPAPQFYVGVPACSPAVCNGTSATCPGASCTSDANCAVTHYCAASGTCQPHKGVGTSCGAAVDCFGGGACRICESGFCTDGVCCASACDGACDVCKSGLAGSTAPDGTCVLAQLGYTGVPACSAYACDGSSATCPNDATGCSTDAQCGPNYYCAADNICKIRLGNGLSCNLSPGQSCAQSQCRVCASGNCVDGVCCDSTCGSSCDVCNKAGSVGVCSSAGAGTSGSPSCAPYKCATGADCMPSCSTTADCISGFFCENNLCIPQAGVGAACSTQANCGAGLFCIDQVCCVTDCLGSCLACSQTRKGQGEDGICGYIVNGSDPDSECPDQSSVTCGTIGTCNGAGSCSLYPDGTPCGTPTCSPPGPSGAEATSACNGVGQCLPGFSKPCAPYVCGGNACATSCVDDFGCSGSTYCNLSTKKCETKLLVGTACTRAGECQGNSCADGFCCNEVCAAPCMACSAAKKGAGQDGECGAVASGSDPDNECSADLPSSCGKDGLCNGNGECRLYQSGTKCGNVVCSGNNLVGKLCDGLGFCQNSGSSDCSPYLCQADQCSTSCANSSQCGVGKTCLSNGTCATPIVNGDPCQTDDQCKNGHCADGVCCDTDCKGQCEQCNLPSTLGICTGIAGQPAPGHGKCLGAGSECGGECKLGVSATCTYPASTKTCSSSSCDNSVSKPMVCSGAGACVAAPTKNCIPYSCDSATKDCRTSCDTNSDCATGAKCNPTTKQCAITTATCKDPYSVLTPDGTETNCLPYKCENGACLDSCKSKSDCASGSDCVGSKCVTSSDAGNDAQTPIESAQPEPSSGGCGCRTVNGNTRSPAALALMLLGALVASRLRGREKLRGDKWTC